MRPPACYRSHCRTVIQLQPRNTVARNALTRLVAKSQRIAAREKRTFAAAFAKAAEQDEIDEGGGGGGVGGGGGGSGGMAGGLRAMLSSYLDPSSLSKAALSPADQAAAPWTVQRGFMLLYRVAMVPARVCWRATRTVCGACGCGRKPKAS